MYIEWASEYWKVVSWKRFSNHRGKGTKDGAPV